MADAFRLFPLITESTAEGAFAVLFGPGYIRFLQDGGYILDTAQTLTVSGGVFTAPPTENSLIFVDGIAEPLVVNADGSVSNLLGEGVPLVDGAVSIQSVTTLSNPYLTTEFFDIGYAQARGALYLAHYNHPPRRIFFDSLFGWQIEEHARNRGRPLSERRYKITWTDSGKFVESVEVTNSGSGHDESTDIQITDPTGTGFEGSVTVQSGEVTAVTITDGGRNYTSPVASTTGAGTGATFEVNLSDTDAATVVAVSAIVDGKETGTMRPTLVNNIPNFTQVEADVTYSWTAVERAEKYRVYRSLVFPNQEDAHIGYDLGLIGETIGTSFADANIQPDFTQSPIIYNDPFAPGAVTSVDVEAEGSGYNATDILNVTDEGGGEVLELINGNPIETTDGERLTLVEITQAGVGQDFVGYPIVQNGNVIGVFVANHGRNYVSPKIEIICNPPDQSAPPVGQTDPLFLTSAGNVSASSISSTQSRILIDQQIVEIFEAGTRYELEKEDGQIIEFTVDSIDFNYKQKNEDTILLVSPSGISFSAQAVSFRDINRIQFTDGTDITFANGLDMQFVE